MKIQKFQQGGAAPMPAEAAPQQTQDPLMEIAQMMMQGLESGDCQILAQACEAFLGLLSQAQAPAQAPIGADAGSEPVFKKGGKIVKRKKCSK